LGNLLIVVMHRKIYAVWQEEGIVMHILVLIKQ